MISNASCPSWIYIPPSTFYSSLLWHSKFSRNVKHHSLFYRNILWISCNLSHRWFFDNVLIFESSRLEHFDICSYPVHVDLLLVASLLQPFEEVTTSPSMISYHRKKYLFWYSSSELGDGKAFSAQQALHRSWNSWIPCLMNTSFECWTFSTKK